MVVKIAGMGQGALFLLLTGRANLNAIQVACADDQREHSADWTRARHPLRQQGAGDDDDYISSIRCSSRDFAGLAVVKREDSALMQIGSMNGAPDKGHFLSHGISAMGADGAVPQCCRDSWDGYAGYLLGIGGASPPEICLHAKKMRKLAVRRFCYANIARCTTAAC